MKKKITRRQISTWSNLLKLRFAFVVCFFFANVMNGFSQHVILISSDGFHPDMYLDKVSLNEGSCGGDLLILSIGSYFYFSKEPKQIAKTV